ncbi:uncharacterized protein EI90DRAFT_3137678 [Cantharellus anzutake]|uniref:uncharacterized protein n=1 Tax=Cantharellus anzutake TaxID=1750568 RepID=UPI0019072470|nr:uncharacterized protein EI90DRAFT_3137678 [Cantharellus anzutake]KAF8312150.1 hypothetical protein EI90DRAFT_3137678 [Cantharellus anzutake]
MKENAQEDTVVYISGALLIINDGPEVIDGLVMMVEATTVESLGILADDMQPSNGRLATAHFVGQVTTATGTSGREFGLNVGAYSAKDKTLLRFEVHLHFDDSNHRFDKFRIPRPGSNIDVQAKWKSDSVNRTHWVIENISYVGPVSTMDGTGDTGSSSSPNKCKRLFGSMKPTQSTAMADNDHTTHPSQSTTTEFTSPEASPSQERGPTTSMEIAEKTENGKWKGKGKAGPPKNN